MSTELNTALKVLAACGLAAWLFCLRHEIAGAFALLLAFVVA